jgi:hypothetical protein
MVLHRPVGLAAVTGKVRNSDEGGAGSPSKETAKTVGARGDDLGSFLGAIAASLTQMPYDSLPCFQRISTEMVDADIFPSVASCVTVRKR